MELLPLYDASMRNAAALVEQAELLLSHRHHARAFALAFTAYEEIGKAQLIADFFNDVVSEKEFEAAFQDHRLKAAYVSRVVALSLENLQDATIEYDRTKVADLFLKRTQALYVDRGDGMSPIIPSETIDVTLAEKAISRVKEEIHSIQFAEYLNGRIGSKGLFK